MSDLLTKGEYEALAASIDLPGNAFIDGGFRAALSGKTFTTTNPATGAPLAEVAPSWRHPRTGQTVAQMLAALDRAALEGLTPLG